MVFKNLLPAALAALLGFGGCSFLGGCQPNYQDALIAMTEKVAASMTDQAAWKEITAEIEGDLHNPGVEVRSAIVFENQVNLLGTHGELDIGSEGFGQGQVPPEVLVLIEQHIQNGDLEAAARLMQLYGILGPTPPADGNGDESQ